ncbi:MULTISPECIES: hypothetical protein [unclassified Arthrobacter]|uniref:hypothetical protein n=1 Tax=unclassified Arthrobacter TaxID=235627 RepID=UPI001492EC6F|nr:MULTISPECIES: hypothetical protein [unclassified Arthrobacter]MBE0008914.1 hypothetical protein [Arthrobacter sp. AET 35A]NOJ62606.1 hypothetical protein [Arthrobacter sp. 147(2020)]
MMSTGGPGWQIVADSSPVLLFSLYLRDCAGLEAAGSPLLPPVIPPVRRVDPSHLVHAAGGLTVLRIEWETWWHQLVGDCFNAEATAPQFPELDSLPALQLLAQAHYGAGLDWARERRIEYAALARRRGRSRQRDPFEQLVQERELELGRDALSFTLQVVELPLSEARAWFVEPGTLLMSQDLAADPPTFSSYVRPVVELLA